MEPITVSLNYLDEEYDFSSYYMIGISGGGWTTVIYSAIDDRISNSFSVAGSYPLFLRSEIKNGVEHLTTFELKAWRMFIPENQKPAEIYDGPYFNRLERRFFFPVSSCRDY